MTNERIQSQSITCNAKAANHPDADRRDMTVVAECFTRVNVADMQFDGRDLRACDGVAQGDGGVGISPRIDQHRLCVLSLRFVQPVDQHAFVIGLAHVDRKTKTARLIFQLAGLVLLVAMIGAIVLTLRHRTHVKRQDILAQIYRERAVELKDVEPGQGV